MKGQQASGPGLVAPSSPARQSVMMSRHAQMCSDLTHTRLILPGPSGARAVMQRAHCLTPGGAGGAAPSALRESPARGLGPPQGMPPARVQVRVNTRVSTL
jgi:hypothetical protein